MRKYKEELAAVSVSTLFLIQTLSISSVALGVDSTAKSNGESNTLSRPAAISTTSASKLEEQAQPTAQEKDSLQKGSEQIEKLDRESMKAESMRLRRRAEREVAIAKMQAVQDSRKPQAAGQSNASDKQSHALEEKISRLEEQLKREQKKTVELAQTVAVQQNRLKKAELHSRGDAMREEPRKQDDPLLAISLNDVGLLLAAREKYDQAIPLYLNSLSILKTTVGTEHPFTLTVAGNVADALRDGKHFDRAASLYRWALTTAEKVYGKEDIKVAMLANDLGYVCKERKEYSEAEALYKRGIQIIEKAKGNSGTLVAGILNNYAALCLSQDRFADAEPLLTRAAKTIEAGGGPDHPSLIVVLQNLASLYERTGQRQLSQQCAARARRLLGHALEAGLKK